MIELSKMISEHLTNYPLMQPTDILKLIYQNEFGNGHMVKDEKTSFDYLLNELDNLGSVDISRENHFEDIGNGYVRVHLDAIRNNLIDINMLNSFFVRSARVKKGTSCGFVMKAELVSEEIRSKNPDLAKKLLSELEVLKNKDIPIFSHSEIYRQNYMPSYRVIDRIFIEYLPLFSNIEKMRKAQDFFVIAIDGRCGAGKSTLASKISTFYGFDLIHADDFFLPFEMRTQSRLLECGGNIHYERLYDEVITNLISKTDFTYKKFDCHELAYTDNIFVSCKKPVVIEGVYSMREDFRKAYDTTVFLDINSETQKERIKSRNGDEAYQNFKNIWIPMEEAYINHFKIDEICDYKF